MRTIRIVVMVLAVLMTVPLIIALFVPRAYTVEREIVINKPKQDVFNFVKMLKNQDKYNKWLMADPNLSQDFRGTDGTVGFVVAWDSKKVGKGEQEIKKLVEGELLGCETRFEKPFKSIANTTMTTEAVSDNQTKIKWVFAGTSPYPMNMMNLVIDKMLGGDLAISLGNLKVLLEKQ
ncbi:MAG: polyketide cyclase [Flavipsychrobacter sp.]|nr:polyketide cyclase [Flavipsychrobacter sp.]